jgi:hypothetical protein
MPTDVRKIDSPVTRSEQISHWQENVDGIESREQNASLKQALIKFNWHCRGHQACNVDESDGDDFEFAADGSAEIYANV